MSEVNTQSPYEMTIDLNVLNHLGIHLYSNVPAVISEAVANAWDGDADKVEIDYSTSTISITDTGIGMSRNDLNEKYLKVGYARREHGGNVSPDGRAVMGRKGIGKLSLFSIANKVEVQSVKDGQKQGLTMELDKIKAAIGTGDGKYHPPPVKQDKITIDEGSRITLSDLKRKRWSSTTETALRKRLARRFSIIGTDDFRVFVNGEEVTVRDRDDLKTVQFMWEIGRKGQYEEKACPLLKKQEFFDGIPDDKKPRWKISGWIGAVEKPKQLETIDGGNMNSIVILARGRLIQENILDRINEGGLFTKYLTGQIEADFLDLDDEDDIATSDRQRVVEDDERYRLVEAYVTECIRQIKGKWTEWRKELGVKSALEENAKLKNWYEELPTGAKKFAKSLIGKIETLKIEDDEDKRELYRHGILAFEHMRMKDSLDQLELVLESTADKVLPLLAGLDDIENTLYSQIVKSRIQVIRAFQGLVDENEKEKVLQKYLFNHLWLLDPSWERATGSELIETRLTSQYKEFSPDLTEKQSLGRVDIAYRTTAGKHIIVELKRANKKLTVSQLLGQGHNYVTALRKCLLAADEGEGPIEVVFVIGRPLDEEQDDPEYVERAMSALGSSSRVKHYDGLIENALRAYDEYIQARKKVDRIANIVDSL